MGELKELDNLPPTDPEDSSGSESSTECESGEEEEEAGSDDEEDMDALLRRPSVLSHACSSTTSEWGDRQAYGDLPPELESVGYVGGGGGGQAAEGFGHSHSDSPAVVGGAPVLLHTAVSPDVFSPGGQRDDMPLREKLHRAGTGLPIDWTACYDAVLALPDATDAQRLEKFRRMCSLYENFLHTAVTFGKIIISEAYVDSKYRTISPVALPGRAGGAKYIYNGIFFKFVRDHLGLYKGDQYAMKAGGHELTGVMRLCEVPGIHVPLTALIDFRGFRLVAMSILPIDRTTLAYGSDDYGNHVHADNPALVALMQDAARRLNLKEHLCGADGTEKKMLCSPTDLEGHVVIQDGKEEYYLLDFARLFPPTADYVHDFPHLDSAYLFRLFRPEFIRSYTKPLSSDALSPFGSESREENDGEVVEATRCLLESTIPAFAEWLDRNPAAFDGDIQPTEMAHRRGINCRYLGRVRECVKNAGIRKILLLEMVARVAKNWLRELLRSNMIKFKTLEEDVYKYVTINFFNLILGWPNEHDPSIMFWGNTVKERLALSFPRCLSQEELKTDLLDDGVDMPSLFERIQALTGVRIKNSAMKELKKNPRSFKVVVSDIKRIDVVVKHTNIVSVAEGSLLSMQATQMLQQTSLLEGSERLFQIAMLKFDRAIRATPDSLPIIDNYANVLISRAVAVASRTSIYALLEKAIGLLKLSNNSTSLMALGRLLGTLETTWHEQDKMLELSATCFFAVASFAPGQDQKRLATTLYAQTLLKQAKALHSPDIFKEAGFHWRLPEVVPLGFEWIKDLDEEASGTVFELHEAAADLSSINVSSCFSPEKTLRVLPVIFLHSKPLSLDLAGIKATTNALLMEVAKLVPTLTSLNVSSCPDVTEEGLSCVVESCPALCTLRFTNCKFVGDKLGESIRRSGKNIRILSAGNCRMLSNFFAESIGNGCPGILNLDLSGTAVSDPSSLGKGLETLKLNDCRCDEKKLLALFENMAQLKSLSISACDGMSDGVIETVSRCCPALTHLDISACSSIRADGLLALCKNKLPLRTLILDGCADICAHKEVFEILAQTLRSSLEQLGLHRLEVDDDVLRSIAQYCHKLRMLDLGATLIEDCALLELSQNCTSMTVLNISSTAIPDQAFAVICSNLSNLMSLDIAECQNLAEDSFKALANLRALEVLRATKTSISDVSARGFAPVCTKMRKLVLRQCPKITDDFVAVIAEHMHKLEMLDLSGCILVSMFGEALASGCPLLKALCLDECRHVTDATIKHVSTLPHLQEFCISGCENVTDESITLFDDGFRSLRELVLKRNKISNSAAAMIEERRPEIDFGGSLRRSSSVSVSSSVLAQKRLLMDHRAVLRDPLPSVSALPLEENIFVWHANLYGGAEGSPYHGGIFHFELVFPHDYPSNPPYARLLTELPHPHVINDRICMDILADYQGFFDTDTSTHPSHPSFIGWTAAYGVQSILVQLQAFLLGMEDSAGQAERLQACLKRIPSAVERSRKFVCPKCPHHAPDSIWPPLPCLSSLPQSLTTPTPPLRSKTPTPPLTPPPKTDSPTRPKPDSQVWRCYHLGTTSEEDIIGFGCSVRYFSRNGATHIKEMSSPLEPLSYQAYHAGVRESIMKKRFTHFIPLYINKEHAERAKKVFPACISLIATGTPSAFTPFMAVDVLAALMNSMLVSWLLGTETTSIKGLDGYTSFHRLMLMIAHDYPEVVKAVNTKIEHFRDTPASRVKNVIPDLGRFLQMVTISSYHWDAIAVPYLEESFDRSVLWVVKRFPELGTFQPDPTIDATRPEKHFEASKVSLRLALFHVYFLENIARPTHKTIDQIMLEYDRNSGLPSAAMRENLLRAVRSIMQLSTWEEFFHHAHVPCPPRGTLINRLLRAVAGSLRKGYHDSNSFSSGVGGEQQYPHPPPALHRQQSAPLNIRRPQQNRRS